MRSAIIKRSIVIDGHKTSISLEDAFWRALKDICEQRGLSVSAQVQAIDTERNSGNLSSAVRLFVLDYFRTGAQGDTVALGAADTPIAARTLS
jgi:predicted DNA-binding ribbon-helix-helix protein